jgi:tetratricopeptide (TPR) repeat protein
MRLGICKMRSKNWGEAIAYFNESLELSPNQALAYYYIAASYGVLKEHVKAKENLQKALSINPNLIINEESVLFKYL